MGNLVKICGITEEKEVNYVNEAAPDFMGMVVFFPKSKRNISLEQAAALVGRLAPGIRSVAVTVKPTLEQIRQIEAAGFDFLQIHGDVSDELLSMIRIPVIKAFNVSDLSSYDRYHRAEIVKGYIFDAQMPGSGKRFDYSVLDALPKDDKFSLLAGGLTPENVADALAATQLSGADTSSGVENENGVGKSREKILAFVRRVRES